MKKQYFLSRQTIDTEDLQNLIEWLESNPWLTQGPLVHEFERRWAEWLGVKYATFVNSGSSANLLTYYALLVGGKLRNNKVIVPVVSWPTTVSPAIQLGFEPIMCEADKDTFGININHLEALLRERDPSMVIVDHVLGVPTTIAPLLELKERFNFILVEDACTAVGSRYDEQLVGTFGDISTFSFYYGHQISTIEGGMVCTNDEELHDILLQIRGHGWAKDLSPEKEARKALDHQIIPFNRPFTFYYPGFNLRSTDLNARIGLSQLSKLDHVIKKRVDNHNIYQSRFLEADGFHCQSNSRATISSMAFSALASSHQHREKIARVLKNKGIETRPLGGGNMSRQPFWTNYYETTEFPVADRIHTTAFKLPNHPLLGPEDIHYICDQVLST
jgi:CDP-6-deoxy-D-xylo-4-hexulose-3-dehydrase